MSYAAPLSPWIGDCHLAHPHRREEHVQELGEGVVVADIRQKSALEPLFAHADKLVMYVIDLGALCGVGQQYIYAVRHIHSPSTTPV